MFGIKNVALRFLSYLPVGFLFKPFYSGAGTILFMHKVVEKRRNTQRIPLMEANEIEVGFLEKMILYLKKKGYEFLSLEEMNNRLDDSEKLSKKFVVFTFDDGYKDNLTLAYPVFKKHNVPFTVYITNCFPNKTAKLWWYLLEDIVLENSKISLQIGDKQKRFNAGNSKNKNRVFNTLRDMIITSSPKEQLDILEQLEKNYNKKLQCYLDNEAMDWDEIKKLCQDPLVTIGGHTINHITLNKVTAQEAMAEIMGSKEEIENLTGKEVSHFAYPFGTRNEVNEPEMEILKRSRGFKTATTTRMGNIFKEHREAKFSLPRIQVLGNQQRLSILNLYLSGFLPAMKNRFKRVITV